MTTIESERIRADREEAESRHQAALRAALESGEFNEGEQRYIKYQFDMASSFWTRFFHLLSTGDAGNIEGLRAGFPEEVAAWEAYRVGALGKRLGKFGVDL